MFGMLKNVASKATGKVLGFVAGVTASGLAMADGAPAAGTVDYTALTSKINFGGVTTAVMAIAVSVAGVYIAIKGAKIVIAMIKGG